MEVDVSQPNPSFYSHIAQQQLWLQGKEETRTDKNQHYLTEGRGLWQKRREQTICR